MPNPATRRNDMWGFANAQGDPNGNMSHDEAQRWAEDFARLNPGWTGNATFTIDPRTGEAKDTSSWLARNGWIFPVIAATGIALGPMLAAAAGGGGAAAGGAGAGGAGAGAGTLASSTPWALTPYAGTALSVPTGAAAVGGTVGAGAGAGASLAGGGGTVAGVSGAGAGAGAAKGILGGLTTRDLVALGLSGAGTIGGVLSNNNTDTTPTSETQDPQMKALLELMANRLRKSEPNFDSAQAMAQGLLPTQYQRGGGGMG